MSQSIIDYSNILRPFDLTTKKGVLVIGTVRCGSHFLTDVLLQQLTTSSADRTIIALGELATPNPTNRVDMTEDKKHLFKKLSSVDAQNGFQIASIVTYRTLMAVIPPKVTLPDYLVIKLRRRDKIAQYRSVAVMEKSPMGWKNRHAVIDGEDDFLIKATADEISWFLNMQYLDSFWESDLTIYYEDLVKAKLHSEKQHINEYINKDPLDQFENPDLVQSLLGSFRYLDDR